MRQPARMVPIVLVTLLFFGASTNAFELASIDGGALGLDDWRGRPVLAVNAASRCGFTPQFDGVRALHDRYRDSGLVVLAVPSNDVRPELSTEVQVKEFYALNLSLDQPMTEITHVKGDAAHPFCRWLADSQGFTPAWNFHKVLLASDGSIAATYYAAGKPTAAEIAGPIEALLSR